MSVGTPPASVYLWESAVKQIVILTLTMLAAPCIAGEVWAQPATLLIEGYNADGTGVTLTDFIGYTRYVASSKWQSFENYGVFRLGELPAARSLASPLSVEPHGTLEYMSFAVPANQPIFFTALWKAQGIGTVFMRADNAGAGYTLVDQQRLVLQLPYEFARSEYALADRLHASALTAGVIFSVGVENDLRQSAALVESARTAASNPARGAASYQALSIVMLLKEQIVLETSNHAIFQAGARGNFEMNYEGFGSWTDTRFVPDYQRARLAGFKTVLTFCDWSVISPSRGTYDFTVLDFLVDQAKALGYDVGLTVNQSIGAMPPWVRALPFDDLKAVYFENARRVAERYRGKVAVFYPSAEPELNAGLRTLVELGELVRASLDGARAGAPGTPAGLYTSGAAYVNYQMNPPPTADFVSGWTLLNHLVANNIRPDFIGLEMQYGTAFAPIDLQRMQELLRAVSDAAQAPVLIGETGYSSKAEDYGINGAFFWHGGLTQQAQAEWAEGVLRIAYAQPFIRGFYWVHVDPDDFDYGSDFLSSLLGSALFRTDGTPKRVYAALQDFAHQTACSFSLSATASSVVAAGSPGSVAVNSAPGCSWSAVTNVPWIVFTSPIAGAGTGTVFFSVIGNTTSQPRIGMVRIAGRTLTVTQAPATTLAFDRAALNFAAVLTGLSFSRKTAAQTVRLTQSGPGTVTWTATSNAPWLTVTPSSGTGSRELLVDIQFVFGQPSQADGAITVTASGAANTLAPITVNLRLLQKEMTVVPTGQFETPQESSTPHAGSIAVTGWALDDVAVTRVSIWRDPVPGESGLIFIGDAIFLDGARPDVQAAYSSYPLNTRSGWGYLMLTNSLPNRGNGTFTLHAIAEDVDGHSVELGRKTIVCDNAHSAAPFGAIDTPGQGQIVSGLVANFGWVLSPFPSFADPPHGGAVTVFVDGVPVGSPAGWAARPDLVAQFPAGEYPGIDSALGVFGLDTTALTNGVHTIHWIVTATAGGTSGVGSRFFTVSNGTAPPGPAVETSRLRASVSETIVGIDDAPVDRLQLHGRSGFDLDAPLVEYAPIDGRIRVPARELDRIELHLPQPALGEYVGYLRSATQLLPLPIGSHFDLSSSIFTWMPGAGFSGAYDLVFVLSSAGRAIRRHEVRIFLDRRP